jgi:hypothetical protein
MEVEKIIIINKLDELSRIQQFLGSETDGT